MCVPGAIAATSAAMVMRNPADAARLPDGSHPHRDRCLGVDDGGVDVPGGVEQPARRTEREDEECGTSRIRLLDGVANVLANHRLDDAVHFGGVDDRRTPLLRASCRGGEQAETRGHQSRETNPNLQRPISNVLVRRFNKRPLRWELVVGSWQLTPRYVYLPTRLASRRFASADAGSRTRARSSSVLAAAVFCCFRYASASATRAAAESALQMEIFSASTASAGRLARRWMRPTSRCASAS